MKPGIFALITMLLLPLTAPALEHIGQVKNLSGSVTITGGDGQSRSASVGDFLLPSDVISTGDDSSVGITFIDNSRFSAGSNTLLALKRFSFDTTTHEGEFVTGLERGTLAIVSGKIAKQDEEAMKVELKSSILGVRGTRFLVEVH